jgi:hypothetical protein
MLRLPSHELGEVLTFLSSTEACCLRFTCKAGSVIDACESFWKCAYARDWPGAEQTIIPISWRQAWAACCAELGHSALPFMSRASRWWRRIESFSRAHFPALSESLCAPATAGDLRRAEEAVGRRIPPALRAVYQFHNGQIRPGRSMRTALLSSFAALFGCSFVYDDLMFRVMLPIGPAAQCTADAFSGEHAVVRPRGGVTMWCFTGRSLSERIWVADDENCSVFVEDSQGVLARAGTSKPGL